MEPPVRAGGLGTRGANPGPCSVPLTRGGGDYARGDFRGETFAVKKGGETFPWRNFGVTIQSFTTAEGFVFPEKGKARL